MAFDPNYFVLPYIDDMFNDLKTPHSGHYLPDLLKKRNQGGPVLDAGSLDHRFTLPLDMPDFDAPCYTNYRGDSFPKQRKKPRITLALERYRGLSNTQVRAHQAKTNKRNQIDIQVELSITASKSSSLITEGFYGFKLTCCDTDDDFNCKNSLHDFEVASQGKFLCRIEKAQCLVNSEMSYRNDNFFIDVKSIAFAIKDTPNRNKAYFSIRRAGAQEKTDWMNDVIDLMSGDPYIASQVSKSLTQKLNQPPSRSNLSQHFTKTLRENIPF